MEKISSYTRDDLSRYHAAHYRPNNMVAVLVGDFDPGIVKPMIRQHLGAAVPSDRLTCPSAPTPLNAGT